MIKLIAISFVIIILLVWGIRILNWLWLRPKKLEKRLRRQGFKGNSYKFFIGDLKELSMMMKEAKSKPITFSNDFMHRIFPFLHKTINNYGKNCFMWFGPKPAVIITDPELIREIFSKNYTFPKLVHPVVKLLAQGVASYENDKWAKHRRLINPAFHMEKLKLMVPAFHLSCSKMLSQWEKVVSCEGKEELDIWPYLQTLTSDAIARTAFGSSYEEGQKIFQLQREQIQLVIQATWSTFIPGWRYLPTKKNRMIRQHGKEVCSLVMGIINERMKAIEAGEATKDDLLDLLLESNFKEIQQHGKSGDFGMTIDEVIEECKLFYMAGQETTSVLLVWTMISLSKHLDWQSRAREEVMKVFGNEMPDFEKLNQLKIVSMIINEALRLYPPGTMFNRVIEKDTKLGDLDLPGGITLLMPAILLHNDTELWGEDAKEFNPERFREGTAKATNGKFSFFPFGWGPRICIGINFAMLEAKMALSMILQQFEFELSPSYAHAPHTVITLQPQHGAQLKLRKL